MAAVIQAPPQQPPRTVWMAGHPRSGRVLRWLLIAAATVLAFHESLRVLIVNSLHAGVNGYTWVIPAAGLMAAYGLSGRAPGRPAIHDRQTDVIVGVMGLTLALMMQGVLVPRYDDFFALLRLDLQALLVFVASAGVLLFGLRAVTRYWSVWLLMALALPLPYHLTVILLGGGEVGAGVTTLLIAGVAAMIAFGHNRTGALVGAAAAWGIGLAYLVILSVFFPDAPLLVYQLNPSLTAIGLISLWLFLIRHRAPGDKPVRVEVLSTRDVRWGTVAVLATSIALAVLPLPPNALPPRPPRFDGLLFGTPLHAPAGWHVTGAVDYDFVKRLYGRDATLVRQTMVANMGNPAWDKFSRPRTVVVDTVTTSWPMSLEVFPPSVLYGVSERLSQRRTVDLGHGVTGQLVTAVDDGLLLTWNVLSFEWRNADGAQRVLVGSVDNHEPDAHFPPPTGAILKTLNTMLAVLLRGNAVAFDETATYADADLLTAFCRGLVDAQIRSAVGTP